MKWLIDTSVFFAALNSGHDHHRIARRWLNVATSDGWAISVETFLAAVRLLMNPTTMKGYPLASRDALRTVRYELTSGGILVGDAPDDRFLAPATGHRQIMEFYLVQMAARHALRLVTFDAGILKAWPKIAFRMPHHVG